MINKCSSNLKKRTSLLSILYIKIIQVFIPCELDDDMKKLSGVATNTKKVYCCVTHSENFGEYKVIKEKIKGGDGSNDIIIDNKIECKS